MEQGKIKFKIKLNLEKSGTLGVRSNGIRLKIDALQTYDHEMERNRNREGNSEESSVNWELGHNKKSGLGLKSFQYK